MTEGRSDRPADGRSIATRAKEASPDRDDCSACHLLPGVQMLAAPGRGHDFEVSLALSDDYKQSVLSVTVWMIKKEDEDHMSLDLSASPDLKSPYTLTNGNMDTAPTMEPSCTTAPHHTRALWPSSLRITPMMTFT
ncbi:hypothetical protein EYF80_030531 [Liparis tanakae]|uniref:Uncharacterized protein n=1 Tax=Liparis tanakae TaxID=230148 RepID=A0A4Z2H0G0_9TELE|nr:hypothetical protein EYF80_030531 [Liparis tanakae]